MYFIEADGRAKVPAINTKPMMKVKTK